MDPHSQSFRVVLGGAWLAISLALPVIVWGSEPRFPEVRRGKVFVRLAPQAMAELREKSYSHESRVDDVILGTKVHGKCQTVGTAQIKPREQQGFELIVTGQCVSTSWGENGPATIHTTTTTDFVATSAIVFDRDKGFVAGPVAVEARTRMKTNDIETAQRGLVGRIVRGVAERRVEEARPIATEIARQKTSQRIESAIAAQLEKKLEKVNRSLDTVKRMVALLDPEITKDAGLLASQEHLLLYFHGEGIDHVALAQVLPEMSTDSELWVHRSVVNPELETRLAALALVRDAAEVVVNTAVKVVESKIAEPYPDTEKVDQAKTEHLLDRHGDWYVVRVSTNLAEDQHEITSK